MQTDRITCRVDDCGKRTSTVGLCHMHYRRWRLYGDVSKTWLSDAERFWSKVTKGDGCWLWNGTLTDQNYGAFGVSENNHQKRWLAHRWSYTQERGEIPDGLPLDHTCHKPSECQLKTDCPHRRCVRPSHLEPVTAAENVRRSGGNSFKTHCPKGHTYDMVEKNGQRRCRACRLETYKGGYARRKARLTIGAARDF